MEEQAKYETPTLTDRHRPFYVNPETVATLSDAIETGALTTLEPSEVEAVLDAAFRAGYVLVPSKRVALWETSVAVGYLMRQEQHAFDAASKALNGRERKRARDAGQALGLDFDRALQQLSELNWEGGEG